MDLPGQPTRAAAEAVLWRDLLRPHQTAWVLAAAHEALGGGGGGGSGGGSGGGGGGAARHRAHRLAGLGGLLRLLGPRAAEPATGRCVGSGGGRPRWLARCRCAPPCVW